MTTPPKTTPTVTALVIPVEGPLEMIELPTGTTNRLAQLQEIVEGCIQSLPLPPFLNREHGAAYINEDGKGRLPFNPRATDFFVPGIGLFFGDYIAGPLVLVGTGLEGETTSASPEAIKRARLIESEAA